MSTGQIARDSKYHVGSSTDVLIASTPATLYYENQFSFLPPSCTPSTSAIQRCDVYNTASVRGLLTHLDLNFDLTLNIPPVTPQSQEVYLNGFSRLFEWVKIYLDNVEVLWMSGTDIAWMNQRRNQVLDSLDEGDFQDKVLLQGGDSYSATTAWSKGVHTPWDASVVGPPYVGDARVTRVQIPLDMLTSFLFHKWDTRNVQKISVEIKYRHDPDSTDEMNFLGHALTPASPGYKLLNIQNSWITQRAQLYTDPAMFKPITSMYTKPLIKTEKQTFKLPVKLDHDSTALYNANKPMTISFRLGDSFSIHKRVIGLAFGLEGQYNAAYSDIKRPDMPGACWQDPNCFGCRIYKGGKLVEDLTNTAKFARQSNHFYRCLGTKFLPSSKVSGNWSGHLDPSGSAIDRFENFCLQKSWNLYQGIGNNMLSFLDRGLAETNHMDNASMLKVQLIGGISNAVEENWEIECDIFYNKDTYTSAGGNETLEGGWPQFQDRLKVFMLYTELLGVQPNPSGDPSAIKIFS